VVTHNQPSRTVLAGNLHDFLKMAKGCHIPIGLKRNQLARFRQLAELPSFLSILVSRDRFQEGRGGPWIQIISANHAKSPTNLCGVPERCCMILYKEATLDYRNLALFHASSREKALQTLQ
jgi:hypothetical protein